MTPFRFFVLLAVCVSWGMHFIVVKLTVTAITPVAYAALRMTLVAAVLSPLLKWHPGQMGRLLFAGACFGALNYAFMFSGLRLLPASVAAILIELYVPFAMGFSVLFLGERIGWRRSAGAGLAVLGAVVITSAEGGSGGERAGLVRSGWLLGVLFMTAAAACEAMGAIQIKKISGLKPLELLAWFGVVGAVILPLTSLVLEEDQFAFWAGEARWSVVSGLLYSVFVASLFGHASYYWLIQRVDVSLLAPAGLLTTVVAVGGGVFILGETLTPQFIGGGVVTLAGVAIIVFRSAAKAAEGDDGGEVTTVSGPQGARIQESLEETSRD